MALPSDLVWQGMDYCCHIQREGKVDPLGNHWVADNPASSSGLTDVEIMSYNYSHGGGAFKIPVKPEYIFQEMS